ncbi:unnamed protein product [Boreogadus saida]
MLKVIQVQEQNSERLARAIRSRGTHQRRASQRRDREAYYDNFPVREEDVSSAQGFFAVQSRSSMTERGLHPSSDHTLLIVYYTGAYEASMDARHPISSAPSSFFLYDTTHRPPPPPPLPTRRSLACLGLADHQHGHCRHSHWCPAHSSRAGPERNTLDYAHHAILADELV